MTTPKTVRVRVAVAVSVTGRWGAYGYAGCRDKNAAAAVDHGYDRITFIEADVPLPEKPETVEAEVME